MTKTYKLKPTETIEIIPEGYDKSTFFQTESHIFVITLNSETGRAIRKQLSPSRGEWEEIEGKARLVSGRLELTSDNYKPLDLTLKINE